MADGNITVEVSTQAAQAELERLRAENARLAREAHAWWTAARDAAVAERERCAQRVALHSQYPIQTDYDRGYDKARKDAAETLRNMSTYVSTYAPDRPSTPVGWSDTDWLKHLDEIRQNEAAYARGPRRYLVADRRNSVSAAPLDRLDWARWFTDGTSRGLYLHVWSKDGETCHRVFCRHSDTPRLKSDGGRLWWLVDDRKTPNAKLTGIARNGGLSDY